MKKSAILLASSIVCGAAALAQEAQTDVNLSLPTAGKQVIAQGENTKSASSSQQLAQVFNGYFKERLSLFPLEATTLGIPGFNDKLYADFTDEYRSKLLAFYTKYQSALTHVDRSKLNEADQLSYDVFKTEMHTKLGAFKFHSNYIPANQFEGMPITMGQLGSGRGMQPFKTVADYDNWLARMNAFGKWTDDAIVYYRKGMDSRFVLPVDLVVKMLPQLDTMVTADARSNFFYSPIRLMPDTFSVAEKQRLTEAYVATIEQTVIPAYRKLRLFLEKEYLPVARKTAGVWDLPEGKAYYQYLLNTWTTTRLKPEQIHSMGLREVKRIRTEMERVKNEVGFKGDLNAFFDYMGSEPKFMPFKTADEVLQGYASIYAKIESRVSTMFGHYPKAKFEMRQTEAFRAASASPEYNPGTPDGSRPGIFYVPVTDATQYNVITNGTEALFLHEAIPGHHYQVSLQLENDRLPYFRRTLWYGAYGEGWGLYTESLGKELGLYTDPYQYMGYLGKDIHRAIRMVVDTGMHAKKMTREQAIRYTMENEAITEAYATQETERYMANPGQAVSYKLGSMKIRELREHFSKNNPNFKLSDFHDEILSDANLPLDLLETKMTRWAARQK